MSARKRVLLPIDFSECGKAALEPGLEMARRLGAEVTLLHVVELPEYAQWNLVSWLEVVSRALDGAQKALAAIAEGAGDLPVESTAVEGDAAGEILRLAREGGFELIAMGTHGRSGIRHALVGSVAEEVLRAASCPVLTVRCQKELSRPVRETPTESPPVR